MAGTLSSLGIGSSGALSAETIDKLKANDQKLQIDPITRKIELTGQQNQAYDLISSLMSSLSASTGSLSGDLLYLDRSTSVTGDAVSVTASAGVSAQSFSLEVADLATKEIQESDQFIATTSFVASGAGTISIGIGASSYDIDVTATTTLEELAQSINNAAGDSVKAQVLNVADGDYRLILTSKETGSDQTISVTDSSAVLLNNLVQGAPIQAGTDAHFKYNGINFTRSSNSVDDISVGINITLNEVGLSNVTISQNSENIVEEMKGFVAAYNSLSKEIDNSLTADPEKGTIGVFNGDNTFKSLTRDLKSVLFSTDGNNESLAGYFTTVNSAGAFESAFELTENGVLTFNETVFKTKFDSDPTAAEEFLKYSTNSDGDQVDGLFKKLDDFLENQIGFNGTFTQFGDSLNSKITKLEEEQLRTQELLNARYDTMFLRFAAFDKIIGGLERQFSSLSLQIEAAINAKN
jgi:flagellar hook-associated protein 2